MRLSGVERDDALKRALIAVRSGVMCASSRDASRDVGVERVERGAAVCARSSRRERGDDVRTDSFYRCDTSFCSGVSKSGGPLAQLPPLIVHAASTTSTPPALLASRSAGSVGALPLSLMLRNSSGKTPSELTVPMHALQA
jgi:hypothetical protein